MCVRRKRKRNHCNCKTNRSPPRTELSPRPQTGSGAVFTNSCESEFNVDLPDQLQMNSTSAQQFGRGQFTAPGRGSVT
jgi:hypothetical protein